MGQVSIQQMLIQQRVPRKTEAEALISLIDVNSYFDLRIGYWQQLLFIFYYLNVATVLFYAAP